MTGRMVPMQPRSIPSFFSETKAPAFRPESSAGRSFGASTRFPVRTKLSRLYRARRTYSSSAAFRAARRLFCAFPKSSPTAREASLPVTSKVATP